MSMFNSRYPQIRENLITHYNIFHIEETTKSVAKILIGLVSACIFYEVSCTLNVFRNADLSLNQFYFLNYVPSLFCFYFVFRFAFSRMKSCKCGRSLNLAELPQDSGFIETQLIALAVIAFFVSLAVLSIYKTSSEHIFLMCGLIAMVATLPIFYYIVSGNLRRLQIRIDIATSPELRSKDLDGIEPDELKNCAELARKLAQHSNHALLKTEWESYVALSRK